MAILNVEKPTVGRKVWLWGVPGASVEDQRQPFDATVILVHAEDSVSVAFTNHRGTSGSLTYIPLVNPTLPGPGEDGGSHGCMNSHTGPLHATWMPYQMKQAARANQHPALAATSFVDPGMNTGP